MDEQDQNLQSENLDSFKTEPEIQSTQETPLATETETQPVVSPSASSGQAEEAARPVVSSSASSGQAEAEPEIPQPPEALPISPIDLTSPMSPAPAIPQPEAISEQPEETQEPLPPPEVIPELLKETQEQPPQPSETIPAQSPEPAPQPEPEVIPINPIPQAPPTSQSFPAPQTPQTHQTFPSANSSPKSFLAKALAAIRFRKKAKLEKIMKLANEKRLITNDQVQKLLRVSDATATRYLSELVRENRLKRTGTTIDARYEPLIGSIPTI